MRDISSDAQGLLAPSATADGRPIYDDGVMPCHNGRKHTRLTLSREWLAAERATDTRCMRPQGGMLSCNGQLAQHKLSLGAGCHNRSALRYVHMVVPTCRYSTMPARIKCSTSSRGSKCTVSFFSTTLPSFDIMSP